MICEWRVQNSRVSYFTDGIYRLKQQFDEQVKTGVRLVGEKQLKRRKGPRFNLFNERCVSEITPDVLEVNNTPTESKQQKWREEILNVPQNTNLNR